MAVNPIDCSQDLTQIGNVLVLEVDNILRGWPTYVVNVIPDHPGPLKLVLCLKEPSLYKWKDDKDNQDLDNEKTRDQSGMSKEKEDKDVETLRRKLANITLSLPMMVKYNNTTAGGVPSPAVNVEATPITLCGIHNDPVVSRKCNRFESFSDNTEWPPHCPRPFKDVPMNLPIKALEMFKTLSEPVEAVGKENAGTY
ncbi:hypothetical protein PAXRUDRAFT_19205 [Paxillus rubicundulus Ve08.2h10]|uniref:Uncharacterized protein n=1 Tax=Paxillus rubicundulus Ve08.2h10 TaxID=930991 RepID=A0A0D0DCU3_9AGAM|nr:hypothetical protein PAXRUDRAFT_19205 [Paxillus rubicundulus Ve08.2h10]